MPFLRSWVRVAVFALAFPAVGQAPPTTDDAWLTATIARLDSDRLEEREAASAALASDPRAGLPVIERAYSQRAASLSPEAVERLTRVAVELFRLQPRGAMGMSFANPEGAAGVQVRMTVPGFAAEKLLQAGDVIEAMDGVPVRFNNDARAIILSHDPGEAVHLDVVRQGARLAIDVPLGSFEHLQNASEPGDPLLASAWKYRCARLRREGAAAAPPIIDANLPEGRWSELIQDERRQSMMIPGAPRPTRPEDFPRMAPGGAARGVPLDADDDFGLRDLADENPKLRGLMAQRDALRRQVVNAEAAVRNGRLTPQQKQAFQAKLEQQRRACDQLTEQVRMLSESILAEQRKRTHSPPK